MYTVPISHLQIAVSKKMNKQGGLFLKKLWSCVMKSGNECLEFATVKDSSADISSVGLYVVYIVSSGAGSMVTLKTRISD